ncbi:hypothetical protein C0033_16695 [Clostridium sp. chh4-2]|uniref:hypothetical protein n=1 Tax=Clostridium sp. chh4-2 TaxID=2067550 RepID=UPI000CCE099E|nr:hypothetical protein [Clostridium sp. chh4-2]PNV60831.1 hypothetical protein C0033_16695 [Clostridium sp. chh4-2]
MLQFLETGKALYLLAAVCLLGMFSRLVTRNLYKRLIKETDNMTLTKNKYLRDLKQKTESTYRLSGGIRNIRAYIEKQIYSYRFMGISLNGWGNISAQLMFLNFIAGGVLAFASYWYRCDSYYVVLYGSAGILLGMLTMMVDSGLNLAERRQQLLAGMQDYMENTLLIRLSQESKTEPLSEEDSSAQENTRNSARERTGSTVLPERKRGARNRREPVQVQVQAAEPAESQAKRDVDYLKQSLEQIAASREKRKADDSWIKELNQDELQLIGEIIREYLA